MGSFVCKIISGVYLFSFIWLLADLGAEVQADERQRLYRSAYYLGRGDTGIAEADDQEAIFYNPAGLARGDGIYKRFVFGSPHIEISKSTKDLATELQVEDDNQASKLRKIVGSPQHVGLYSLSAIVFRRAALGVLVSNQGNALVRKSPDHGGLETVGADFTANQGATFSLAERFGDWFHIGATGKYINRSQAEFEANIIDAQNLSELRDDDLLKQGSGFGTDVGIMTRFADRHERKAFSLGVTAANLGDIELTPAKEGTEIDPVVQTFNVGVALSLGTRVSRFRLLADYRDITGAHEPNPYKRTHFGAEISVADMIGVTGGLNQGYPTGGLYFDFYLVRLDLGYYAEEAGDRVGSYPDERYYLRLLVGI